jgi:hypothetical protein
MTTTIPIESLVVVDSWNIRADALCKGRVASYTETYDDLPPVTVANISGKLYLVDGWHRMAAALTLGKPEIVVNVDESLTTEADARIAAFKANVKHGVFLTNDQKQRWFHAVKELRPQWTQEQWGEALGVRHTTIGRWLALCKCTEPSRHMRKLHVAAVSIENLSNIWTRWTKAELKRWPVERWSADYRQRVKSYLRPIAEFHNAL